MAALRATDLTFIERIDGLMPERGIAARFNEVAALPPEKRLDYVLEKLKSTWRSFCPQLGVPRDLWQSVHTHQENMAKLITTLNWGERAREIARLHDVMEGITSDFTPRDPIRKAQKLKLEQIAADLVFEAHSEKRALWDEYEARKSISAIGVKEADLLELAATCLHLEKQVPSVRKPFNEVWTNVENWLNTNSGRAMFKSVKEDRKRVKNGKEPISPVYKSIYGP